MQLPMHIPIQLPMHVVVYGRSTWTLRFDLLVPQSGAEPRLVLVVLG